MTEKVRLGLVGMGNMGRLHADYMIKGEVKGIELAALCDTDESRLSDYPNQKHFTDSAAMIRSGEIDAVLIATPHYLHTSVGIDALQNGLHVMVEKPLSVHKADCERLIAAHTNPQQVFAAMFQQRTFHRYRRLREMVHGGELGEITRINWIITDWFRSNAYYASASWRGTWKGEGGGVLINQCPHNLDILQWVFGMPSTVRAFCRFGAKHNIEVEDEVTAYLEWPNGATGVLVMSTGEVPGTNRLEVCGDKGRLVIENSKILWSRNEVATSEFNKADRTGFSSPAVTHTELPYGTDSGLHAEVMQNFVDAILEGAELIAPAEEGIKSVELANAMIYSTLTDKTVELPLDSSAFERALKRLIRNSRFEKSSDEVILDAKTSIKK